jgi:methylthioribose-1-phosphate isomerase
MREEWDVDVDWAQMQSSADGIERAHGNAQEESQAFQAQMASHGEPWGINNAVGQAIGMCYTAVSAVFTECNQDNLGAYGGYPAGIREMVTTGRATEQANTDDVGSVRSV